tara:strand:+ start:227 stop:508 length:282 start_codon:yes stop_codon:yes gene_type:complete
MIREPQIEIAVEELVQDELVDKKDLIVYNDDYNTFDHVIDSLVKVCKHEAIQAEQCTWLIHHKGKCQVKRGEYETLEPLCTALLDRGISAEIE